MKIREPHQPKRQKIEAKRGDLKTYFREAIARGLSQEAMAKELGVTKATLNKWLRDAGFRYATTYVEVAA